MSRRKQRGAVIVSIVAALLLMSSALAEAQPPKIVARSLSHQEIIDFGLPEDLQVSGGLFTVGVGTPVYLEVLISGGAETGGATWALDSVPDGSSAALAASPLGSNVPIASPGDREVFKVAGRQLLLPDAKGQYVISAVVDTNGTAVTLAATVTAADYVGVGNIFGASPQFPQCAMCHGDLAEGWAGTGHAHALPEYLDGLKSSHFNEGCLDCHATGYNPAPTAVNGGFDDVAAQLGWLFPEELREGNWATLPPELKTVSSVQCESCHGPGSEHGGAPGTMSVSLSAGDCAQCHAEEPFVLQAIEWEESRHSIATRYPTGEGRGSCVGCHSGIGFIDRVKGAEEFRTGYEAITCQVCHDPHDASNPHQLRTVAEVTLMNGEVISEGGTGKLCMNCHMSRRDADVYVQEYHNHYGPHHGPQADMLVGTNAVEYGQEMRNSAHLFAVEDACATCHMPGTAMDDPARTHAGGHTFKPTWDNGTPDDPSDDLHLTAPCVSCHGPMDSFDLPRDDFNGNGVVEGVQTEVAGLMDILGRALPPMGEPDVAVTEDYTSAELKAAYNYEFVREDGSMGVHNTRYTVGILRAAIKDLTGRNIITAVTTTAEATLPESYELAQNYPNPFNPETEIRYAVAQPGAVSIEIYNNLGQRVRRLVDAHHSAGQYNVTWDGKDNSGQKLAGGVYVYTMHTGEFVLSKRMVLLP